MPFKFRDLIVTFIPPDIRRGFGDCDATSGGCDSTSGGCGGTCDAGGSSGTVGSCTSECGGGFRDVVVNCGLSDEVLDPLKTIIDPPYLLELRILLRHAVARSMNARLAALEKQMLPTSREDADLLEKQLTEALAQVRQLRQQL